MPEYTIRAPETLNDEFCHQALYQAPDQQTKDLVEATHDIVSIYIRHILTLRSHTNEPNTAA